MFIIDFRNKNVSDYRFSVMNNSNVDVVHFYSHFSQYATSTNIYLKIRSANEDYVDKIAIVSENVSVEDGALLCKWTMGAVSTHCKKIYLQLQFEKEGDIVAQTGIVSLTLGDTIDVDGEIIPIYPQVLKHLQDQIDDLGEYSVAGASMNYADDLLTIYLVNKDNETLTSLQVSIPTSDKYTKEESDNKFVAKTIQGDKIYGTNNAGQQTVYTIDYGSTFTGNIVRRNSDNQIYVPLVPTAQGHATSKAYVDGLIDEIEQRSDVVDVVGTYADLEAYDTSHLAPNSLIKVINDETHHHEITYYRWVITDNVGAWVYVASEGAYYTTSQIDTMLLGYYATDEHLTPTVNNNYDLGENTHKFRNLYLGGSANIGGDYTIREDNTGQLLFTYQGANNLLVLSASYITAGVPIIPLTDASYDIGGVMLRWKDVCFSGSLKDGIRTATLKDLCSLFNKNSSSANAEIKWTEMLSFSKSADTTFTFETAKSDCLSEYKALITNSGASTITLTFTSISKILCNDDNCVITNGTNSTLTLPSGATIEINAVNNCLIAVNFEA